MIVKLVLHKQMDAISIWSKDGQRLYYSDQPKDIKVAKELLSVIRKKTDKELAAETMGQTLPMGSLIEQRMQGYFNAYWKNKIIQIMKRANGYGW